MKNQLIHNILNNAPDPIIIQSDENIVWVNAAACRLYGVQDPQLIVNQSIYNFIHPDYSQAVRERMVSVNVLHQLSDELEEYEIVRKDGSSVLVESKGEPIIFEGKHSSLVFLRDISQRKALEQKIRSNEQRLRFALEASQIGVWDLDVGKNKVFTSPIHDRIFGYEKLPHDWTFEFFLECVYPYDREKVIRCFEGALESEKEWNLEFRIIRADGQMRWVFIDGKSFKNDHERINRVIGIVKDITESKEIKQKLIESEDKFRNLFHNHLAVKLVIDPETGDISDANQAAALYYGWSVEELKQMKISQINILSGEEIRQQLAKALRLQHGIFYFQHRNAKGEIMDVEVFSSRIVIAGKEYIHAIILDIGQQKVNQNRLMLLSRSVEQSPVAIMITSKEGVIEYVNPCFEQTTGFSLEKVKGKNPRILKSGYHTKEFYSQLWQTILSGNEWTGEILNKKRNGQQYWEKISISPILDNNREVVNFVSIREDITERRQIIEDLVQAKDKAEENDRLKLAFLANISHEIRTPMNGILGFANILKKNELSRLEQLRFINIIEKSGQRMLETVNDLIDIASIETGQVQIHKSGCNINEVLVALYDFFLPQAIDKGLVLVLNEVLEDGQAVIITDSSKLDSILTNLIKNAIKFTHRGTIEFGCRVKGDLLEFFVRDTGIGVPPERLEAIFRRFEQADMDTARKYQGSGLGLAITKAYVNLLEGDIWVESKVGTGSVFYFSIPRNTAPRPRVEMENNKKEMPGIPALSGKSILLAEDDMYSREMIVYLLNKTGARVIVTRDGKEAVEEFTKNTIDIVLMDIQLPVMDGIAVLKEIRKQDTSIPVIAQTAYALPADILRFKSAGFTDCLTKPINPDNLYLLVSRYMNTEQITGSSNIII